jgi:hypothetical protein
MYMKVAMLAVVLASWRYPPRELEAPGTSLKTATVRSHTSGTCPEELDPESCRRFRQLSDSLEHYRRTRNDAAAGGALAQLGELLAAAGALDSARAYYGQAVRVQLAIRDSAAAARTRKLRWEVDVRELLAKSPLLDPLMGTVRGQRYVGEVRRILSQQMDSSSLREIRSPEDATQALEAVLAGTVVRARVQSEPANLVVQYRRAAENVGSERSVTTNDVIPLAPALYVFQARDPVSGEVYVQRKQCATPCLVRFVFRGRVNR